MSILDPIKKVAADFILERPFRNKDFSQLAEKLTLSGQILEDRIRRARDTDRNRGILSHIIGIERWGQARLRVFLGEPFTLDEYDGYRPSQDATWDELAQAFRATRAQTVALIRELAAREPEPGARVLHNQFGPLTARGWLRYLDFHANAESKKFR